LSERSAYLRNSLKPSTLAEDRKANAAYASLPSIIKLSKNRGLKPLKPQPKLNKNNPLAEPSSPATWTNFLELRSQNPVASDVAAVDEPGYTHTTPTRQLQF
jgi:hypothetical protein